MNGKKIPRGRLNRGLGIPQEGDGGKKDLLAMGIDRLDSRPGGEAIRWYWEGWRRAKTETMVGKRTFASSDGGES